MIYTSLNKNKGYLWVVETKEWYWDKNAKGCYWATTDIVSLTREDARKAAKKVKEKMDVLTRVRKYNRKGKKFNKRIY